MGKPGGGGGGSVFNLNITADGSVGTEYFHDLGAIPTSYRIWFGSLQATAPDKSVTFEVRTSNVGKSAGNTSDTTLLASVAASLKSGTKLLDMYKSGRLHTVSVLGSGVERFWIRLVSKGTPGAYLFSLNYTLE